jgi:Polyketide cyclase / dehydrase and lipid transport
MWQHHFETKTELPVESIWPVLADVARWAEIDHNIDRIEINATPARGVPFKLKPKGGPVLAFVIGDFDPPTHYSDICRMPFAKMKTLHTLTRGAETIVSVDITIAGPLAQFWGFLVGRKHASGLPAQTERILMAAGHTMRKAA